MARKKADQQPETPPEPQPEPQKPGGRTIGAWRKQALNYLGKGADDSDVTAHIAKLATEAGYVYQTTDEETREWRGRVQAEIDGTSPATPRSRGKPASTEVTLTDLMTVMAELKNAELPDLDGKPPIQAWTELIDRVDAIAAKIGGVQNLKRCLAVAANLTELTK